MRGLPGHGSALGERTRRSPIASNEVERLAAPIIAMSANVLPEQIRTSREAGMDNPIGKPFNRAALDRMVDKWPCSGSGAMPPADQAVAESGLVDRRIENEMVVRRDRRPDRRAAHHRPPPGLRRGTGHALPARGRDRGGSQRPALRGPQLRLIGGDARLPGALGRLPHPRRPRRAANRAGRARDLPPAARRGADAGPPRARRRSRPTAGRGRQARRPIRDPPPARADRPAFDPTARVPRRPGMGSPRPWRSGDARLRADRSRP